MGCPVYYWLPMGLAFIIWESEAAGVGLDSRANLVLSLMLLALLVAVDKAAPALEATALAVAAA